MSISEISLKISIDMLDRISLHSCFLPIQYSLGLVNEKGYLLKLPASDDPRLESRRPTAWVR